MVEGSTAPLHAAVPRTLARNLSFHFLWSSTFASGLADRLAMLAVAVMLGQGVVAGEMSRVRLGDAAIVAAINFWFFLPYVIWGPVAGWLADRLPRKWIMFVADESRGIIILFAFFLLPPHAAGPVSGLYDTWFSLHFLGLTLAITHAWKIWLMMFFIGMFAATFSPARNSVIPNVVGFTLLQRANAMVLGMGVIGNLLGFALGGGLAEHAIRACILASSLGYIILGFVWPFLKTPAKSLRQYAPRSTSLPGAFTEITDGARYVFAHKPVLVLTIISVIFWTGSHIILAAGSAIAVQLYGGNISDFALIGGGFGLGMLLGAAILGTLNSRTGGEIVIAVGMIGCALFLSLLAIVPSLTLGIALAVCCGLFGGFLMITINTLAQQLAADSFRGRVMGFKDLAGDIGGVGVSLFIWITNSDEGILTLTHLFSALLLLTAFFGIRRYVLRGPLPRPSDNFTWRLNRLYVSGLHRLKVEGQHHVPRTGPLLLIANHTAGLDPLLIQAAMQRKVRWLMAREMKLRILAPLWYVIDPILVDRSGKDRSSVRQAIEILTDKTSGGGVVGIFPEGGIGEERWPLRPFAPGLSVIIERADPVIVPVYISDTPGKGRTWAGFFRFSHSKIRFGRPLKLADLNIASHDRNALAEALRQRVAALAEQDGF
ncbi:MAG: MFS transporter [Phycisphaerales bacterium]